MGAASMKSQEAIKAHKEAQERNRKEEQERVAAARRREELKARQGRHS